MNEILDRIKFSYNLSSDVQLAEFLSLRPNTLAMHRKRGTLDIFAILEYCSTLDLNWLLRNDPASNSLEQAKTGYTVRIEELEEELKRERKRSAELEHEVNSLRKLIDMQ